MSRRLIFDELHVLFLVPRGLSLPMQDIIARTINDDTFLKQVQRTVRRLVRRHPSMEKVLVKAYR